MLTLSALGAGCSLINAFDDVAPQKAQDDGGVVPPGVDASQPDTGGNGDATVDAGADAPDTGVVVDAGPRGVIVVGGTAVQEAGADLPVVTALDPATGAELLGARQPMNVAAVLYDGKRDMWFLLESGGEGPFPLPSDPFFVHARTIDPISGKWTELGSAQIPAGLSYTTTGQLAERIAYIAYGNEPDGGSPDASFDAGASVPGNFGLVVVDTSNPASMTVASVTGLQSSPVAVVGVRSLVNPAGGIAALGATAKPSGTNVTQITPVLIPATDPPAVEAPILGTAPVGGSAGFAAVDMNGATDIVAISRGFGAPSTPASLAIFNPSANDPTQALVGAGHFPFGDGNIKAPAFAKCEGVVFVLGTNADLSLYAVSLAAAALPDDDGGTPLLASASAPTGHSGQAVYFEPFTSTVLTPFSQGNNFALTAFTLGGTPDHPTLAPRVFPHWNPPADLRPSFVATRTPLDFACATPSPPPPVDP
jgi:hypothetical protein